MKWRYHFNAIFITAKIAARQQIRNWFYDSLEKMNTTHQKQIESVANDIRSNTECSRLNARETRCFKATICSVEDMQSLNIQQIENIFGCCRTHRLKCETFPTSPIKYQRFPYTTVTQTEHVAHMRVTIAANVPYSLRTVCGRENPLENARRKKALKMVCAAVQPW